MAVQDTHQALPSVDISAGRDRLEAVYRQHHEFVWRSARRLGVETGAVDDVVHEVFIVVSRRLDEFAGRSTLQTWLFGITMRVAQNHKRAQWRHDRRVQAGGQQPPEPAGHARSDAALTLHRMLAELSDDQRAAYILGELDGCSVPEIARALDANVNTLYARIRAARALMTAAAVRIRGESERVT